MKIKFNIKKNERFTKYLENLFNIRLKIPKYIRLFVIGTVMILFLISAISAIAAISKPEKIKDIISEYSYTQTGIYDYTVYLKNNTIYDDARYLKPGKGIFFRN